MNFDITSSCSLDDQIQHSTEHVTNQHTKQKGIEELDVVAKQLLYSCSPYDSFILQHIQNLQQHSSFSSITGSTSLPFTPTQCEQIWERVTDDGHVWKYILQQGTGSIVPILNRVYISGECILSDGTSIFSYIDDELDFTLGHATQASGLEQTVCYMRTGEEAIIKISNKYGYSKTRRPENVPVEGCTLFMKIKILRFEKVRKNVQFT